jgi:hypothetical protein
MKPVFPYTVYNVIGRMIQQPKVAQQIALDQQLFGAFFSMALKVVAFQSEADDALPIDRETMSLINKVAHIDSKSFSMDELAESTKLADSIRKTLGQHVTSEYLGKFLAFADLFHSLYQKREAKDIPPAIQAIGEHICDSARQARERADITTSIEANVLNVARIYDLSQAETYVLEHATAVTIDHEAFIFLQLLEMADGRKGAFRQQLEDALTSIIVSDADDPGASISAAMKETERVLAHDTSKPLAFNIVKVTTEGRFQRLSQFWSKVIGYDHKDGIEGFDALFVNAVKPQKTYSSVIARVNEKMITLARDVFTKVIHKDPLCQEPGVNILVYGPSKLDKDQALQRALEGIEFELYETVARTDSWGDEASITWAAQRILEGRAAKDADVKHVLLVRDAAAVLSKGASRRSFASLFEDKDSASNEKVELDSDEQLLTKSCIATIWYTADPQRLSKEAVGKFMLHLEVIPGTRADRKLEVEKIANSLNLPAEVRQALSKYMELGAVQVETAAKVVQLLELQEPGSYDTLLQLVEESQRALGRDKTEELRSSVTKYDLGLLNIRSKFSPEQVIDALKKKPQATLCFYGLPGTGKTQLAEYIADKLDKPLLVKRASDILSKWVGENEQNLAEMFREASAEGAILLLDEADSFLRDRAMSKNSWEVTMVNELLQGMERFKGIFICASNLFSQLDAAALRRFTFKFNFLELTESQRVKMFANESGVELTVDDPMHFELLKIAHLTPGDFATVKRQAALFDATLSAKDWLAQLEEEAKAKNAGLRRNFDNLENSDRI